MTDAPHRRFAADARGLLGSRKALLAVSGGPDSIALMHLAARWRQTTPGAPALAVATVDHALRPESGEEAVRVASWAAGLGLPHTILRWRGEKPARRIQEAARDARYALLAAHAEAIGADALVAAHHADDQAETILFRLTRGSGVAGLAGMAGVSQRHGLALHRPLLGWRKAELLAFCAREGLAFVDDPSNADAKFARVRLRRLGARLEQEGLDADALIRLARRAGRANAALAGLTDHAEAKLGLRFEKSYCRLDAKKLAAEPEEIVLRLLDRLIRRIGGERRLRFERLESLGARLIDATTRGQAFAATLGGALLRLDSAGRLTLSPAPARRNGAKSAGLAIDSGKS